MKVRKLLALVLTLLLVFAYGAFAAEGEAQEPGQQTAAQPAQQEAAATQAFERSLNVSGIWLWRYNFTQGNPESGLKGIQNIAWQAVQANFTYKFAPKLALNFAVAWGSYWGQPAGGQAFLGANSKSGALAGPAYTDNLTEMMRGWKTNDGNFVGQPNRYALWIQNMFLTWTNDGFLNEIAIGRMPNAWGFNSIMFGQYAGNDRIRWIGKTKLAGYMALPFFFIELNYDGNMTAGKDDQLYAFNYTTNVKGDELILLQAGLIMVGPGKLMEQIWFTVFHAGLRKYKDLTSYTGLGLYMKFRIGSMVAINFEVVGQMGRLADAFLFTNIGTFMGTNYDVTNPGHFRWDNLRFLLQADIKLLGMLTIAPEIALTTAPNRDFNAPGNAIAHNAAGAGFKTGFYTLGGTIMNSDGDLGTGADYGAFILALKVQADLMGGKISPWLKFSHSRILGKRVRLNGTNATVPLGFTGNTWKEPSTKSLGVELDLGVVFTLADGFTLGIEFSWYLPSSALKNGEYGQSGASLTDPSTPGTGITVNKSLLMGYKNIIGFKVSFDCRF